VCSSDLGQVVPGYGLRAAGYDGRLLLEERTGWVMVDRSGTRTPIQVPWTTVRAIRAMPAGFAVAVEQATPRGRTFELYEVVDGGRVRRAGAYRAFDALDPKTEVTSAALGKDGALWLAVSRWPSLLAIERALVGAAESKRVWTGDGHPTALRLLTGP
jgi:hypothetical protein